MQRHISCGYRSNYTQRLFSVTNPKPWSPPVACTMQIFIFSNCSSATIPVFAQTDLSSTATSDHPETVSPEANIYDTFTLALNFGKTENTARKKATTSVFPNQKELVQFNICGYSSSKLVVNERTKITNNHLPINRFIMLFVEKPQKLKK